MPEFDKTSRNKIRRAPNRGVYDDKAIYRIIDEALICHVGFVQNEQPFVIPTLPSDGVFKLQKDEVEGIGWILGEVDQAVNEADKALSGGAS